ncbi:hypothetical protein ACP26L_25790 [Paenibacillus sp. S-38]|uniref:hypothetical protein n=1 Tax=Paenibacillus sp. S-38 TaxID=3416710 RepID=UPI003CF6A722
MKSVKAVSCKATAKPFFLQGKSYPVDEQYDKVLVLIDEKGNYHHVNTDGEYFADHLRLEA